MKICPVCGKPLPPDAPAGNCPTCLLGLGLATPAAAEFAHPLQADGQSSKADELDPGGKAHKPASRGRTAMPSRLCAWRPRKDQRQ